VPKGFPLQALGVIGGHSGRGQTDLTPKIFTIMPILLCPLSSGGIKGLIVYFMNCIL